LEASALVPELARLGVSSLKIEGRLKGPEYVAATTALYRAAIDAWARDGQPAPQAGRDLEDARRAALQTFTRGSGPGFLGGVNHQRLVEGRGCDHRGLGVGTCEGVERARGRDVLVVRAQGPIARGDGLLVEGAWGGEGEVGGRVWEVEPGAGGASLVWLGPDRDVSGAAVARAGRRVFKTSDPANDKALVARVEREPERVGIAMRLRGAYGGPFVLSGASARGHAAEVTSDAPVERARTTATTRAVIEEKLARLGDTPFVLASLEVDLPDGAMLPVSALNRARRELADALASSPHLVHATTATTHDALLAAALPPDRASPPAGLFVLCRAEAQAHAALDAGADGVVLDFLELTGTGAALRGLRARAVPPHVTLAPPRIRKPGEEKIDRYLRELAPDALLVRSLGALHEGSTVGGDGSRIEVPLQRIGDFSLNVTNRLTAAEVLARGLSAFTPSLDLDAAQLASLCATPFGPWAEIVVHHPMPLFHMEHCVIAALLSDGRDHRDCGRPCERHRVSLRDRTGMDHPVEADVGCRNTVFHAAAQSAASVVPLLQKSGVGRFRIELVRESVDDVARIVGAYRALLAGHASASDVWRTLKAEGGYGVVTGSLRVLRA